MAPELKHLVSGSEMSGMPTYLANDRSLVFDGERHTLTATQPNLVEVGFFLQQFVVGIAHLFRSMFRGYPIMINCILKDIERLLLSLRKHKFFEIYI